MEYRGMGGGGGKKEATDEYGIRQVTDEFEKI